MVSIPCNYSAAAPLHGLPRIAAGTHSSVLFLPPPFTKPRPTPRPINAVGANPSRFDPRDQQQQLRTLFPGGFKRPEIKVPTLVLRLSVEEVLGRVEAAAEVSRAVSGGVGIVVLHGGDESGGRLYEAACVLRPVIGDRAYFLIAERVDVATAVGASGVVLSDQGIPAIVARNMMMKSRSGSIYLPLVARTVRTGKSAVSASSSEGADFLLMGTGGENYANVMEHTVAKRVKVPIFCTIKSNGESSLFTAAQELFQLGACGLVVSLHDVKLFSDDVLRKLIPSKHVLNGIMQDRHSATNRLEVNDVRNALNMKKGFAGFTKLNDKEVQLIEAERLLLKEAVAVIHKAAPMMKDILLLEDAATRLTEPFLLVVVGEFNSGKSTVINALLGRKYLKEGVVPTTNEITLLCYSETDYNEEERCERNPDGQFVCYLSAPILKEMNLVDTPGTNVILQRQQQLTEEFVPRADLILFVLSSDRPLTESEVAFLLYVQQWKKKVVFVLNKLDLYQNINESEEAIAFIRENAQKLLNTEDIRLYPVSARSALLAKLSASTYDGGNHDEILLNDPFLLASRFDDFEKFLFSFMDVSTDTGMERMRLKLETPISIAERLLLSCEKLVKQDYELASQNLISMLELVNSAQAYAMKMENESILWKKQTSSLIEKAKTRAIKLMESILQLSNVDLIATYAFKAERSTAIAATSAIQNDIISPAISDAQKLLEEYSLWLESSIARERKHYMEAFREKWHESIDIKDRMQPETYALFSKGETLSISVIENFSAIAASRLFEQEVREVVLGTFGGVGAAGLSASLLTSVLPTTLEDLLALAFCSAGGLLAISKFSSRRNEAVQKVCRVADGLARDIEEAMQKDLLQAIGKLSNFVEVTSKPYKDAVQHKINKLLEIQDDVANIQKKLEAMKVEIQNLHLS